MNIVVAADNDAIPGAAILGHELRRGHPCRARSGRLVATPPRCGKMMYIHLTMPELVPTIAGASAACEDREQERSRS